MICPKCGSENYVKNGHIHNGKQKYMCRECAGQFAENPGNKIISPATGDIIDNLLPEKISLAALQELQVFRRNGFRNMLIKNSTKCKRSSRRVQLFFATDLFFRILFFRYCPNEFTIP